MGAIFPLPAHCHVPLGCVGAAAGWEPAKGSRAVFVSPYGLRQQNAISGVAHKTTDLFLAAVLELGGGARPGSWQI